MVGITAGFHWYFAYRAYKTGRVFQFELGRLGCAAFQKGPLRWAAQHRRAEPGHAAVAVLTLGEGGTITTAPGERPPGFQVGDVGYYLLLELAAVGLIRGTRAPPAEKMMTG